MPLDSRTCPFCNSEFIPWRRDQILCSTACRLCPPLRANERTVGFPVEKMCAVCEVLKPAEDFHYNTAASDGRYRTCKLCWSEHKRREHARNPEADRQAHAFYLWEARTSIIALLGGKCSCGASENLEIDHIWEDGVEDRKKHGALNVAYYREILAEIIGGSTRFQLLCSTCHDEKTSNRYHLFAAPLPGGDIDRV